ncbi:hypothetical protein F5Y07DRAFT_191677 [Xylaria sp. FL0933]|nr:hypothetical protein F5Y07DRAFT_191677 [Xylaria sp. FL0933]
MTGSSPRHWAAADLHPVSPAPLHPPSPIVVPTLQNQADTYFYMSSSGQYSLGSATPVGLPNPNQALAHAVPAVPVQGNALTGALDPRRLDPESINPAWAVNGKSEKADVISASITNTGTQKSETPQPHAINAEKHVAGTRGSGVDSNARQFDVTTSARGNNSFISQASPVAASDRSPKHDILLRYQFPGNIIADTTVPPAPNAQVHQSPSNHPQATNGPYSVDIQAILDSINAQPANEDVGRSHDPVFRVTPNGKVLPQSTTVLPKLPTTEQASTHPKHPYGEFPPGLSQINSTPLSPYNKLVLGDYTFAAPGTVGSNANAKALSAASPNSNQVLQPNRINRGSRAEKHQKQTWDDFLQHETQYADRANRNGFPEGSRIFLGNLSERVSRKHIFDVFSRYGHVLQISMKTAYGFVQFGTAAEGEATMDNLQGVELGGRKLNLEFARTQTRDGEKSRRSRGNRDGGRHDGNRGRRDDHVSGTHASSRHSDHRPQRSYDLDDRERDYEERSYSRSRYRSQSPRHNGYEQYRRRSPSPYRRHTPARDIDSARHHGTEVPDVQFFIGDVSNDFVSWVLHEFDRMNLRTATLPIMPRQSLDEAIQRLVVDGVHAIVMLDFPAQDRGVISLQLYDRSGGIEHVRYEDYDKLQPAVAAQLVASRRPQTLPPYHSSRHSSTQQPPPAHMPPSSYGHQTYPPPALPDAARPLQDPLAAQSMLAALGNPAQGLGGLLNMGYMNPGSAAPPAGNSTEQIYDILRQLNRPPQ